MNTNEKNLTIAEEAKKLQNERPADDFLEVVSPEVLDKITQADKLIDEAFNLLVNKGDFVEVVSKANSYTQILVCDLIDGLCEIHKKIRVGDFLKNERAEAVKMIDESAEHLNLTVEEMSSRILVNLSMKLVLQNIADESEENN